MPLFLRLPLCDIHGRLYSARHLITAIPSDKSNFPQQPLPCYANAYASTTFILFLRDTPPDAVGQRPEWNTCHNYAL